MGGQSPGVRYEGGPLAHCQQRQLLQVSSYIHGHSVNACTYVRTYVCVIATYHLHKTVCGLNECTGTSTVLYTNEPLVVTMVIYRRLVGQPGKIVMWCVLFL